MKTQHSFYEALKKKEDSEDFVQYWDSLCATRTLGLSKIDYNHLTKDEKLTSLIKDPWFCLFSLLEKEDEGEWLSILKKLDDKVNWDKLKCTSQKFFKSTNSLLNRYQLQEGLDKVMGEVSYFSTLESNSSTLELIIRLSGMVLKMKQN